MDNNNSATNNYFDELKKNAKSKDWNINYGIVNNDSMERNEQRNNLLTAGAIVFAIVGGCYYLYKNVYKPLKSIFNSPTTKEIFKSFDDIYTKNQQEKQKDSTVNFPNRSMFRPIDRSDPNFLTKMFDKTNMLTVDNTEINMSDIYKST